MGGRRGGENIACLLITCSVCRLQRVALSLRVRLAGLADGQSISFTNPIRPVFKALFSLCSTAFGNLLGRRLSYQVPGTVLPKLLFLSPCTLLVAKASGRATVARLDLRLFVFAGCRVAKGQLDCAPHIQLAVCDAVPESTVKVRLYSTACLWLFRFWSGMGPRVLVVGVFRYPCLFGVDWHTFIFLRSKLYFSTQARFFPFDCHPLHALVWARWGLPGLQCISQSPVPNTRRPIPAWRYRGHAAHIDPLHAPLFQKGG